MLNNSCTFNYGRGSTKPLLDQFLAFGTAVLSLTGLVTQKPAQLYQMPLVFGNILPADHSQNSNSKCQSNSKCRCFPEAVAREFTIKDKAKHGTDFLEEFLSLHLWRFSKFKWTWPWIIFSTFENSLPFNRRLDQLMFKFPSNLNYAMIPRCWQEKRLLFITAHGKH